MFKRKRSLLRLGQRDKQQPDVPGSPPRAVSARSGGDGSSSAPPPRVFVDDFGRPILEDKPAFSALSLSGNGPAADADLALLFGYMPLEVTVELSIDRVADLVQLAGDEIRKRGLQTPLILSSMALDITAEGTNSLVRSFLTDRDQFQQGKSSVVVKPYLRRQFEPFSAKTDLRLAEPLSVGSFLKWSLARLINDQGGRGFLDYATYEDFKSSERTLSFPPKHLSTALLSRLPPSNARLLKSLLALFSSICAHSKANGMPPRKLASVFSPFVFALSDDATFDATYVEWQRATNATEHIILAYIRDQEADGPLPTHLTRYLVGYPQSLHLSYEPFSVPKPPPTARMVTVTRFRRLTRFHSRNLIASAGTWDVPGSSLWPLFFPEGEARKPSQPGELPQTVYTPYYRHLLNIRSSAMVDDEDDDGELGRYRTRAEQEWSKFGELGFKDVDSTKLEFDLGESQRKQVSRKRDTMDWNTFESMGFSGRDNLTSVDLTFNDRISTKVNTWPASQQILNKRLKEAEKLLPEFNFDTTPHEEGTIEVDSSFFEAWADALVSSGWARDELKESSFALIQWKRRPRSGEVPQARTALSTSSDDRTEDAWVLIEEFVPREYRERLALGKIQSRKRDKRISFMRTVKRKDSMKAGPLPSARNMPSNGNQGSGGGSFFFQPPLASTTAKKSGSASGSGLQPIDESVFSPDSDTTRQLSLSTSRLGVPAPSIVNRNGNMSYAPSIVSTTNAGHGHTDSQLEVNTVHSASEHDPRASVSTEMPAAAASTAAPIAADEGRRRTPSPRPSPQAMHSPQFASPPAATAELPPSVPAVGPDSPVSREPIGYTKPKKASKGNGFLSRLSSGRKAKDLLLRHSSKRGSGSRSSADTFAYSAEPPSPTGTSAPGMPSLGAVVESPSGLPPPLPPKEDGQEETLAVTTPHLSAQGQSDPNDAYGGTSDHEAAALRRRGSNTSNSGASVTSSLRRGSANGSVTSLTKRKPVPAIEAHDLLAAGGRPDSLPPSPKPDAEVPIVGLYEGREDPNSPTKLDHVVEQVDDAGVRLSQFGFTDQQQPS
ncbi:hypothetical protein OIV83_000804 [Microbotryomycetes sp. JL201]|nr:hypothetical protein OIV83_000804 [Microbotryomycetes sp. JL201]